MKPLPLNRLLTLALALAALGPTAASADHIMVTPADLKWEDAKAIPPGAKMAVIEGPLNEAVPFTIRIKFPAVSGHFKPASNGRNDPATIICVSRHFSFNQARCNSLLSALFERRMPLFS
jgi:hypothetical protein